LDFVTDVEFQILVMRWVITKLWQGSYFIYSILTNYSRGVNL